MAPQSDPEQQVSWRAVPADVPVRSAEGTVIGTLYEVMASTEEDIFHGLVVRLTDAERDVFVPVDDVSLLTVAHVDVDLTTAEIASLPDHRDEHVFHLGWTGQLRKHVGWIEEKDR
jgi:hypothetical protein